MADIADCPENLLLIENDELYPKQLAAVPQKLPLPWFLQGDYCWLVCRFLKARDLQRLFKSCRALFFMDENDRFWERLINRDCQFMLFGEARMVEHKKTWEEQGWHVNMVFASECSLKEQYKRGIKFVQLHSMTFMVPPLYVVARSETRKVMTAISSAALVMGKKPTLGAKRQEQIWVALGCEMTQGLEMTSEEKEVSFYGASICNLKAKSGLVWQKTSFTYGNPSIQLRSTMDKLPKNSNFFVAKFTTRPGEPDKQLPQLVLMHGPDNSEYMFEYSFFMVEERGGKECKIGTLGSEYFIECEGQRQTPLFVFSVHLGDKSERLQLDQEEQQASCKICNLM